MEQILLKSVYQSYEFPKKSRIYTAFIRNSDFLDFVKIPDIQRELDLEWVENLKEQIVKEKDMKGFYNFGIFEIACLKDTVYLLNGQHRYAILKDIEQSLIIEMKLYEVDTEHEMHMLFLKVNGSKPLTILKSRTSHMKMNTIRKHMMSKYNSYLTKSKNPRRPNINLDSLIDKMEECNVFDDFSHDDIIEKIEMLNDKYIDTKPENFKDYETMIFKCKQKNPIDLFVLGMFRNNAWVKQIRTEDEINLYYRQKINKKIRNVIWKKRNGNSLVGKCYVCNEEIDYDIFECAHIISVSEGGTNNIDNMEPTCRLCNNDMGIINLHTYKQTYENGVGILH